MSSGEACPICGGDLVPAVAEPRSSYAPDGAYRIDACVGCGAGTTLPRPSSEDLARYYQLTYGYSTHDLIEHEKRGRSAWLLRWSGVTAGRVLDIGCMYGFLLDEARRHGLETHGIELDPGAAAEAARKGHAVTTGTVEQYLRDHPGALFDAIFAQHVLEHVEDPGSFLAAARRLLRPGGALVVCVPNFEAKLRRIAPRAWGWYQIPFHLVHYTSRALHRVLGDAGFSVASEHTRGGDTLFLALSAAQMLGVRAAGDTAGSRPAIARALFRVAGAVTRPYRALGDDEIAILARA